MSGSSIEVCAAAGLRARPDLPEMTTNVYQEKSFGVGSDTTRWLVCQAEPGFGVGLIALRTGDGQHWRVAHIGGESRHAGDVFELTIFDRDRAEATFDTIIGEGHAHTWTLDGGQTWRTVSVANS